jgi:hypothetical protein
MEPDELEDLWRRTRKRFERAVALLYVPADDRAPLDSYRENVEHNELELALDDLEAARRPGDAAAGVLGTPEVGCREHGA